MPAPKSDSPVQPSLFDLYAEMDRLEELLEDMLELKITSRDEAERRILELNDRIDELEGVQEDA